MKKVLSSALVALMVVLSGCSSNEEKTVDSNKQHKVEAMSAQDQIKEAYKQVTAGNADFVKVVKIKDLKSDLKKSELQSSYTYRVVPAAERMSSQYAECSISVDKISTDQKYAIVTQSCSDDSINGNTYMVNENGWKVPVKE